MSNTFFKLSRLVRLICFENIKKEIISILSETNVSQNEIQDYFAYINIERSKKTQYNNYYNNINISNQENSKQSNIKYLTTQNSSKNVNNQCKKIFLCKKIKKKNIMDNWDNWKTYEDFTLEKCSNNNKNDVKSIRSNCLFENNEYTVNLDDFMTFDNIISDRDNNRDGDNDRDFFSTLEEYSD